MNPPLTQKAKLEKPTRKIIVRFTIWLHYGWSQESPNIRLAIRSLVIIALLEVALFAFLSAISFAITRNLLQPPIVISFGVVELFAFLLYRFLLKEKEQEHSVMEYMSIIDNLHKYAHLVMHFADIGITEPYPNKPQYILNVKTNCAYWVPAYLRELARIQAIEVVKHDTEDDLYLFFETNHVAVFRDYPRKDALDDPAGRLTDSP